MSNFSPTSMLARFLAAIVLVFATYNPSGKSYVHWLLDTFNGGEFKPLFVLAGIALIIGWTIFIRAARRSLGLIGFILAVAFFGTLLWLVIDVGIVPANNRLVIEYLILIIASAILGVGMSWSHVRKRMSGQADVDEIE